VTITLRRLAGLTFAALIMLAHPQARADGALSPAQAESVRESVRDYIRENPEIIEEALQALQERSAAEAEMRTRQTIAALQDDLFHHPDAPVGGNPDGDVTLVEFFDYRCGYCKRVHPTVQELLARDSNIRLVYKELPILGADSVFAARAALAAHRQDPAKYSQLHDALMETRGSLDEASVMQIAAEVGLDPARLRQDMAAPEIDAAFQRNFRLAQALEISGTPSFVVGDTLVPGVASLETFQQLVARAREDG
jgi:protein-disulfide isomerase